MKQISLIHNLPVVYIYYSTKLYLILLRRYCMRYLISQVLQGYIVKDLVCYHL